VSIAAQRGAERRRSAGNTVNGRRVLQNIDAQSALLFGDDVEPVRAVLAD
jgi:hypothetical protein